MTYAEPAKLVNTATFIVAVFTKPANTATFIVATSKYSHKTVHCHNVV